MNMKYNYNIDIVCGKDYLQSENVWLVALSRNTLWINVLFSLVHFNIQLTNYTKLWISSINAGFIGRSDYWKNKLRLHTGSNNNSVLKLWTTGKTSRWRETNRHSETIHYYSAELKFKVIGLFILERGTIPKFFKIYLRKFELNCHYMKLQLPMYYCYKLYANV